MKLAFMGLIWWVGIFASLMIFGWWGFLTFPLIFVFGVYVGDRA